MERRPKARRSVDFVPHDPNAAPMPKHRQAASPNKPLQERSRNAPVVQRPLRKVAEGIHVAKKHSKSKQTVSIAGVLKKRARVPHRRRHSRKEPTPEATLLDDVQDGIEDARDAILARAEATFDKSYNSFTEKLGKLKDGDAEFLETMDEIFHTLSEPIEAEKVTIEITNSDGSKERHTFAIGARVAAFKKLTEKEEAKQKDLWKQWDELQTEYMELGVEMFGVEPFGEDAKTVKLKHKGYSKEMELLDLELKTRVEELEEELLAIPAEYLKKLNTSEKELDAQMKKEQARLLTALLAE